jgi:chromosome segregation ATPase
LEGRLAAAVLRTEITSAQLDAATQAKDALDQALTGIRFELEAERQNSRSLSAAVNRTEQSLSTYRASLDKQEHGFDALRAESDLRIRELTAQLERVNQDRAFIAGRCDRMTKSFSWRCTAPMRLFRRWLIDPLNKGK